MKEGRVDKAYGKVEQRTLRFLDKIEKESKNSKPAFQEPVKPIDKLYMFHTMAPDQIRSYIAQNGVSAWVNLVAEMDAIERRYKNV